MSGDAALDVVIVAYRSRELLRECLGSLRAHPPAGPMKVVVVDNASADGTPEMIASEFPEVEPIASAGTSASRRGPISERDGETLPTCLHSIPIRP